MVGGAYKPALAVSTQRRCGRGEEWTASYRHARLPRNSAAFDFPGVIFVIRPDPRRNYFSIGGGEGSRGISEDCQMKIEE